MAAAGTLGGDGCPGPASIAVLPAPSPSSSDTSRMSAITDSLRLLHSLLLISMPALTSTTLNGSAPGLSAALCPCPSPCPSAPAATPSAPPFPASACPPFSLPSPFPTTAPSPLCRPVAPGPSSLTVSGLSGDEGDDTSADVTEDAGEGGRGAAPACMLATSARTVGGWLGCGSDMCDIALHIGSGLSPAPCRRSPPPPPPFTPAVRAPYVWGALSCSPRCLGRSSPWHRVHPRTVQSWG